VRMGCANCGCVIEGGVRVLVCSDDCCCRDVRTSPSADWDHRDLPPLEDHDGAAPKPGSAIRRPREPLMRWKRKMPR
jgi:hypothetical protein